MATSGLETDMSLRWDRLHPSLPVGENLTTRLAFPARRRDIFIAVDSRARRHVLVEVPSVEDEELVETASRGISVATRYLDIGDGVLNRFIDIVCLESLGHAAMDVVALELIDALDAGASIARAALVRNVLAKWRRFWSSAGQGVLSREAQIGLFGELWFFLRWLSPVVGPNVAVERWRGPTGARHDFEAPGIAVEVKATSSGDGRHSIHGVEQLLEPVGGELLFFSLLVRDEGSAPDHLAGLVAQSRSLLETHQEALLDFEALLQAVGYLDALEREYARLRLRVRSESLYRVVDDFPRMVPGSFKSGVPYGVLSVTYDVLVDPAAAYALGREPGAAVEILKRFDSDASMSIDGGRIHSD